MPSKRSRPIPHLTPQTKHDTSIKFKVETRYALSSYDQISPNLSKLSVLHLNYHDYADIYIYY